MSKPHVRDLRIDVPAADLSKLLHRLEPACFDVVRFQKFHHSNGIGFDLIDRGQESEALQNE